MVVDEKNDREVYNVGKVFTKEWRKAEVLNWIFCVFFAELIQVLDSKAWVRCL